MSKDGKDDTEMRELRKVYPWLKIVGSALGIPTLLAASFQAVVRLPATVEVQGTQILANKIQINEVSKSQQDQKEVLIRLDERGKSVELLLKEIREEVRQKK
jgi:hypothetical protein